MVVPLHRRGDRRELRLCLCDRGTRLQPRDRAEIVVLPRVVLAGLQIDRRPDIDAGLQRIVEALRQDAGDPVRDAVQRQQPARRVGGAAEVLPPDPFADHRDARVGALVGALEHAAENGPRAEDPEVVRADWQHAHPFGLRTIGEIDACRAVGVDGGEIQRPALIAEPGHGWTRQVAVLAAGEVIHADQPIGLVVGQRPQHDGVQDAEDGGIRPDAERERRNHDRREFLRRRQRSGRVLQVTNPAVHDRGLTGRTAEGLDGWAAAVSWHNPAS